MKTAFFHDTRLYKSNDGEMYSVGFSYSLWQRYLKVFDEIVVSTRCYSIDSLPESNKKGLKLSSGKGVKFMPITYYSKGRDLFKYYDKISTQVREVLSEVDCAIIRHESIIGFVACNEAIKMNKPWMVEVVSCAWDALWNYGTITGKVAALPIFMAARHYIKNAPYAVYVSQHFLQHRYPCNGRNIGCSDADITTLSDEILEKRLLKINMSFKYRPIVLGLVGSLNVGYKGHATAIRALAYILRRKPLDIHLRFLGAGDAKRWRVLAEKFNVSDKVEFCGTVPSGEQVLKWFDDIDIYLIPSLQEGLPRALVEAMSRGCPSIGSSTGGIPELIDNRFIHKPEDYRRLASYILHMIEDRDCMRSNAIKNFDTAGKYTSDKLNNLRTNFYKEFKQWAESVGK